ncbi:MAG: UDP-glucose 4-epimerase GalE [Spirochaetaceae bacterium]|jgi:UDP-glucose 4-epimerase|nr:UDP-glucose 4-epimerase GalE [Spirochaetaceae bacterium]
MENAVLVAGGAGYIGSHTVRALLDEGRPVIVLDNLSEGHVEAAGGALLVQADIQDEGALEAIFSEHTISAVMHFCAYAYVGESVVNPQKYYHNNVGATLTLLAAMLRHKVKNIVFSSSCATYGNPVRLPIDESHPQNPVNPYGATKYMVERILADYHEAYGLNYIALRYFNAAGAHPDGSLGESHRIETHLIPLVLKTLTGERERIEIMGADYDTPDGTCIRDYIHVCDLANAHCAALGLLADGANGRCINLGTGQGVSVREVIQACERVTGKKVPALVAPRRAGDPAALVAAPSLAKKILGWSAHWTDIHNIIETAWHWEQNRKF